MILKDFIHNSIKDIVNLFEHVQCRYGYDAKTNTHLIEIVPANFFKESKLLKNYRGQILDKFYELFPTESLAFLSDNSHIKFEEIFRITGDNFDSVPTSIHKFLAWDPMLGKYQEITHSLSVNSSLPLQPLSQQIFKPVEIKSSLNYLNNIRTKISSKYAEVHGSYSLSTMARKDEDTIYSSNKQSKEGLAA